MPSKSQSNNTSYHFVDTGACGTNGAICENTTQYDTSQAAKSAVITDKAKKSEVSYRLCFVYVMLFCLCLHFFRVKFLRLFPFGINLDQKLY